MTTRSRLVDPLGLPQAQLRLRLTHLFHSRGMPCASGPAADMMKLRGCIHARGQIAPKLTEPLTI